MGSQILPKFLEELTIGCGALQQDGADFFEYPYNVRALLVLSIERGSDQQISVTRNTS